VSRVCRNASHTEDVGLVVSYETHVAVASANCGGLPYLRRLSMCDTSRKSFGPIRDAYAFFQQHATETEADIRAYLPHLLAVVMEDQPVRMLDFGCGDGQFTAALLGRVPWA